MKVYTVWKKKQYVGIGINILHATAIICHDRGKKTAMSGVSRVLSGEQLTVCGYVVIAHHIRESLPYTMKDEERIKAEGWKFINAEYAEA